MIKSFKNKNLKLFWEEGIDSKFPASNILKIKEILKVIDKAQVVPQDFEFFKSWKLHPLKSDMKGYWSITVNGNWRIIFRFEGNDTYELNYIDYHLIKSYD